MSQTETEAERIENEMAQQNSTQANESENKANYIMILVVSCEYLHGI